MILLPVGAQPKNKHFLVPQLRTWRFPGLRFVGLIRVHWTHLTLTDKVSVGVFLFLYTSNTDDLCFFGKDFNRYTFSWLHLY